jgi:hypothetical protein
MLRPSFELSTHEYKLEALPLELTVSAHYNPPVCLNSNYSHIIQLPKTVKYKDNFSQYITAQFHQLLHKPFPVLHQH